MDRNRPETASKEGQPHADTAETRAARIRALEARLAEKGTPRPASPMQVGFSHADKAWRMVIEMVTGLAIGSGVGYGLDRLLGTMPLFLILLTLAGMAAGVKVMMGTAREMAGPPGQGDGAEPPKKDDGRGKD